MLVMACIKCKHQSS